MSNPFIEIVECVCTELDRQNIRYALTGSVVSSVYGEPFTSQDVDICVTMSAEQAKVLAGSLPSRFYRDEQALLDAAQNRTMANLIDSRTQFKVDLSVVPDDPFYRSLMERRKRISLDPGGPDFWAVSPEDIVLMKLVWRKDTRSRKQWENALSVMRVQRQQLDFTYLRSWAVQLGLGRDLADLIEEAGL